MTPWRYVTCCLFLFVFLTDMSEENCYEYFNVSSWNLTETYTLRKPKDSKDLNRCTLEKECRENNKSCFILWHCYEGDHWNESEKCYNETLGVVSSYNFLCSTARDLELEGISGCNYNDYEHLCTLYSMDSSSSSKLGGNATDANETNKTDTLKSLIIIISMALNLVLPLAVYLYMRQATRIRTQSESDERQAPIGLQSLPQKISANNNDIEATELLQAVITPLADTTGREGASGNRSMQTVL
ncbi:uncharacterized protein LOC113153743 isoform X3 [Anabas testudineus]|uniref:uncharacterized protein LOC113153743 isoform X3 n=1 Tax=Anabas testudineus TaxID=64144 RepID=UPI000E454471|nr:uncharacterized protein LOC113153743 isoform X3 [Anabas testudineus]